MKSKEIIDKYLSFDSKTNDKWQLQAAVKYFLESGKVTGTFHAAISNCMDNYLKESAKQRQEQVLIDGLEDVKNYAYEDNYLYKMADKALRKYYNE